MLNQTRRSLLTQRPSTRRAEKRIAGLHLEIDAIPFLSLFLTLLFIVFVAKTAYIDLPMDSVTLVQSGHSIPMPGSLREDVMQINLTMDGSIFFNHHKIDLHNLRGEIQAGLQTGAERKVYLWVDTGTRYGDVTKILREVRLAGIEDVSLITR